MLITNENKTYIMNRMETFETNITPVRRNIVKRNVARKSTANRPLVNTMLQDPLAVYNENDFISDEKISRSNNFTNYESYKSSDFGLYYKDDIKDSSKRSLLKENRNKLALFKETTLEYIDKLDDSLVEDDSDEEDENLTGIFCVSDAMNKYFDESILSPTTNYDSSEESIDFSRVLNYPIKQEKYSKSEQFSVSSVSNTKILPTKGPILDSGINIKRELAFDCNDPPMVEPVINTSNAVISDDNNITEFGTETKKCLFDPNLESVTCQVKVREEVLVCENVPLKMTILEANFDVDQLENKVDESSYNAESENEEDDMTIVPQVICAMSLGNIENSELGEEMLSPQVAEKEKKKNKKPKRVSMKSEKVNTDINEKRMTRSQMQANKCAKRITRNSTRLNTDSLIIPEGTNNDVTLVNSVCESQQHDNNIVNDESQKQPHDIGEPTILTDISGSKIDVHSSDLSKDEKSDSKKKCLLDKKGKKEINEGVLLHVEATKETELMRDGKIIKDKEEYLKDIESKIDKNLPVVVEKDFDIQQSLTEEILLDQALRLAHQRTSPRLSKIMKEAILKASVQKTSSKSKQQKLNSDKSEMKLKENKSSVTQNITCDESEITESTLNTSSSESVSDTSYSLEPHTEIDKNSEPNEVQHKKKKDNYIVTPVIKQSNVDNVVEPLTIKICRKINKKKSGFRLSLKKKKSPKKKESISKPVCSKAVNMDDLSKTFEDILHDDSWCSEDISNSVNLDSFGDNEEITKSSESKNVFSSKDFSDKTNELSLNEKIDHSISAKHNKTDNSDTEISINNEAEIRVTKKPEIFRTLETVEDTQHSKVSLSNTRVPVEEQVEAISEKNSIEDGSVTNKNSIPIKGEIDVSLLNKNSSSDETSFFSISTVPNDTPESNVESKNYDQLNDINLGTISTSQDMNIISLTANDTNVNSSFPSKSIDEGANKLSSLSIQNSPLESHFLNATQLRTDPLPTKPKLTANSSLLEEDVQSPTSQNELPQKNSLILRNNLADKPLLGTNIVAKQSSNVLQQQINNNNHHQNNKFVNKDLNSCQEKSVEQLKQCPVATTNTDVQPKVLPLSIASRDPRLRKSHVRVIVEVNTSVSNPLVEKPDIHQETKIISHVIETISKEVDRKDAESDQETSENFLEMERKKKFKKKEVDAELIYKTPLSDLHDVPERSSYTRSIRKRSPTKNDLRDSRNRRKDSQFFQNTDRVPETSFREYHEINMVHSKMIYHEPPRTEMVSSDGFPDYRKSERYRPDSHQPEHYPSYRSNDYPPDLRRRESFVQSSSTEYIHEARQKDFSERHSTYTNHSDHRRLSYQHKESDQELRHSENYPPDYESPNNYSRTFKRPNDFSTDRGHHDSPDFREKEVRERLLERNHISHNEPSYSRWDYAHKKVEGHFPAESHKAFENEEENSQPDDINMWEEERDLIDGPVKKFSVRPYYRRKKFSRGEELFERRSTAWDVENRRYNEDSDRNYERLWVRKTDQELIHGPERWDRRSRKPYRDERSRSPRRDHERFPVKYNRSTGNYLKNRRESSPSPSNSPVVLDSPMSPEPADRFCVLAPTKCLTVPQ